MMAEANAASFDSLSLLLQRRLLSKMLTSHVAMLQLQMLPMSHFDCQLPGESQLFQSLILTFLRNKDEVSN